MMFEGLMSRRRFVRRGLGAMLAPTLGGCLHETIAPEGDQQGNARLTARPRTPTITPDFGEQSLGLTSDRDGLLYVPASYDPAVPSPMLVALHGATGNATNFGGMYPAFEARGILMLAIDSRSRTWDRMGGYFGSDVPFVNAALNQAFSRCNVDPARLGLMGFSDGASYALSLGPVNGDLFPHLMAFSPGGTAPTHDLNGTPRIFVSHGTQDPILSFSYTNDQIVPLLQSVGYDVNFVEFEGGHETPPWLVSQAMDWFAA